MKTKIMGAVAPLALLIGACSNTKDSRYVDLLANENVVLVKDEKSGLMVQEETGQPVILYVDTRTADTIYNPTGALVNGDIEKVQDDRWVYTDGERKIKIDGDEYKRKEGDTKVKIEGDEYKYEDDNVTIKREGGEYKIERKGYTKKVDEDGDIKIETKDKKIKIDGETGERKVKNKSVFSKVKDKVTGQ